MKNKWIKRGLWACVALAIAAGAWRLDDRGKRGMLYPWLEAYLVPANPLDGLWAVDVDAIDPASPMAYRIEQTIARGMEMPTIRIERFRAFRIGLPFDTAPEGTQSEVCLKDGQVILTEKGQPTNYCVRYDAWGTGRVYDISDDGNRLTCITCEAGNWPIPWVRVQESNG